LYIVVLDKRQVVNNVFNVLLVTNLVLVLQFGVDEDLLEHFGDGDWDVVPFFGLALHESRDVGVAASGFICLRLADLALLKVI